MASGKKALDVCAIPKTQSHENSLQHQKAVN
jgi:hypothetical protein